MFIYYAFDIRMYVATIPNRTSPPAILIRESRRDHGKVKSRTIANISSWDPARIESLRRALRGDFDHLAGADPVTVADQIRLVQEQFGVQELVFVGDRGMVKSKGRQALKDADLRYITALTDPQIRRLLAEGMLQLGLFHEKVCEVEADGVRYLLRKNESGAAREKHRLQDKPSQAYREDRPAQPAG
jgi:hypothetical protein